MSFLIYLIKFEQLYLKRNNLYFQCILHDDKNISLIDDLNNVIFWFIKFNEDMFIEIHYKKFF